MKYRILIIDDDEDLLYLAQHFLHSQDPSFELVPATSAQRALLELDEHAYDAIICDYYLGPNEMNGIQILEQIREHGNTTPFIIFTGRSREEVAIKALNLGADYYLEKTDELEGLFTEIGHHIKTIVRSRRTEEALVHSEQKYKILVQSMRDIIFVIDKNDCFEQFHSLDTRGLFEKHEQYLRRHIADVLPTHISEPYLELVKVVRSTDTRQSFEFNQIIGEEERWYLADMDLHENRESVVVSIRDTTERRNAIQALKDSELKFRMAFQNAPFGFALVDFDDNIISVNDALCDMLGYNEEEFLNMHFREISHPEDLPKTPQYEDFKYHEDVSRVQLEKRYYHKDGDIIWANIHSTILHDDKGTALYYMTQFQDITDKKLSEEALRRSEERFHHLFDLGIVGMAIENSEGDWIEVNDRLCELLGYTKDELMTKHWSELTHPEDIDKDLDLFNQLVNNEINTYSLEKRFTRKDGEIVHTIISIGCSRKLDGKVDYIFGVAVDVTERRKAEEALLESEARYRTLIENIPVVSWTQDREGNVAYISPHVPDIAGYTSEEYYEKGRELTVEKIHLDDRKRMENVIQELFDNGKPYDEEYRYYTKDGKLVWVHEVANTIIELNGTQYIIGVSIVITERKKTELALEESEKKFRRIVEELKESEEKYRAVSEQSVQGILIISGDPPKIVFANPAITKMTGFTAEELLSISLKEIFSLIHLEDREIVSQHLEKHLLGEEETQSYTFRAQKKNGTTAWYSLNATRVLYKGQPALIAFYLDVTAQKQTESLLNEEREKFKQYFEIAGTMLIAFDTDLKITLVNDKACDLLGYEEDELIGKDWIQFIPERYKEKTNEYLKALLSHEITPTLGVEGPILTKLGEERIIEWNDAVLQNANGEVIGILSAGPDVTKRKEIEDAVQEQRDFLQKVIESLTHPFFVIDATNHTILMANTAARLGPLTHFSTCYSLTHQRDSPCIGVEHPCPLSLVKKTKKPAVVEHTHFDQDGQIRYLEVHGYPIIDSEGNVLQMIKYDLDITAQKRIQKALEESEKRFRVLYENAPLAYQTLDKNGCIIDVNNEWLAILKTNRDDAIGRWFGDFLVAESRHRFKESYAQFLSSGEPENMEFEIIRSDGTTLFARFNRRIIRNEEGIFKQTQCIFQDITEWKIVENLLLRQNEELSELAHVMSHDLGNKMRNIRSLIKLCREDCEPEILDRIDNIAERSSELLQVSAELAEEGLIIEEREEVDLDKLVQSLADTIIPETISYYQDDLPNIYGSSQKIGQIFQNLLENAVEHGDPTTIEIRKQISEEGTSIIIINDGNPIPSDIREKIFVRGVTTKKFGKGLGLAIVKKLVEAHGWKIELEPVKITTFRIRIN